MHPGMPRARVFAVGIALVAAVALVSCASTKASRAARERAALAVVDHPGVWQAQDHGHVLAVEGGQVRLFEVAGDRCVQQRDLDESMLQFVDGVRVEDDGATLVLSSVLDPYEFRFARVPALPAACTRPRQ